MTEIDNYELKNKCTNVDTPLDLMVHEKEKNKNKYKKFVSFFSMFIKVSFDNFGLESVIRKRKLKWLAEIKSN